jgi:protoporphyrinogen oxidase
MKIAIIGGGITGLTAGYYLSKKNHSVYIFEKENSLGGLTGTFKDEKWKWNLEKYYHHFFSSDIKIVNLCKELGIKNQIFFKKPITSILSEGKIKRFDTIKNILLFPDLSLIDKFQIGFSTVLLKINPFWKPLEKITAYNFANKIMGKGSFSLLWKPLLDSKFGEFAPKIPASWLWTRINKRSFSLGYLEGGIKTLTDRLSEKIESNKGKIVLNSQVNKIIKKENKFYLTINNKKYPEGFDKIIATVSPKIFLELTDSLRISKLLIDNLESLGSLCCVFELNESFLKDKTYWLNINETSFPFVAVVEHTNFIDKEKYNNKNILYVGGYYKTTDEIFKLSEKKLLDKFIFFLKKIYPQYNFDKNISKTWVFKDYYSQPVVNLNYSKNIPKIKTEIENLYWGSLHHVYPQDRGINYAIELGEKIVNEINNCNCCSESSENEKN